MSEANKGGSVVYFIQVAYEMLLRYYFIQVPSFRSKQRDPNPKDNSLIRKVTSTYKGFHSTFAALLSY